jgi:hypothetical protein
LDKEDEEALLRDVPDEFLDPIVQVRRFAPLMPVCCLILLVQSLMRNPVILPVSRQIMDRPVIERHLLNNPSGFLFYSLILRNPVYASVFSPFA